MKSTLKVILRRTLMYLHDHSSIIRERERERERERGGKGEPTRPDKLWVKLWWHNCGTTLQIRPPSVVSSKATCSQEWQWLVYPAHASFS